MKKYYVISSNEFENNKIPIYWRKKILKRNFYPEIDCSKKCFDFIKVLSKRTTNIEWLIKIGNGYYVVLYDMYNIKCYSATKSGKYDINKLLYEFDEMVDMESGCDLLTSIHIFNLINEKNKLLLNFLKTY